MPCLPLKFVHGSKITIFLPPPPFYVFLNYHLFGSLSLAAEANTGSLSCPLISTGPISNSPQMEHGQILHLSSSPSRLHGIYAYCSTTASITFVDQRNVQGMNFVKSKMCVINNLSIEYSNSN